MYYLSQSASKDYFVFIVTSDEKDRAHFTVYLAEVLNGKLSRLDIRYRTDPYQLEKLRQRHCYGEDGIYCKLYEVSQEKATPYLRLLKKFKKTTIK